MLAEWHLYTENHSLAMWTFHIEDNKWEIDALLMCAFIGMIH